VIELSFVALVALLIASNAYWALVCLKLTNRLMSRNYAEYAQSAYRPKPTKPIPQDMSDPVAERNAKDMNAMIGIL
jgi:hypothetical protein